MRNKGLLMLIAAIIAMMGVTQSTAAEAKQKKLKYLNHRYYGQVVKKTPMGEGEITIAGIKISGTFENKTIKNAMLRGNWCSFEGDITYDETDIIVLKAGGDFRYYYYVCDHLPGSNLKAENGHLKAENGQPLNLEELGERENVHQVLSEDMKISSVPLEENLIEGKAILANDTINIDFIPRELRDFYAIPYSFYAIFQDIKLWERDLANHEVEVGKTGFFYVPKNRKEWARKERQEEKLEFKDKSGKQWTIQIEDKRYKVVFPDGSLASTSTGGHIVKKEGEGFYNPEKKEGIRFFPNGVYLEYNAKERNSYVWNIPDKGIQFAIKNDQFNQIARILNHEKIISGKDSVLRRSEGEDTFYEVELIGCKEKSENERMEIIRKYILPLLPTDSVSYEFYLAPDNPYHDDSIDKEKSIFYRNFIGNLVNYEENEKINIERYKKFEEQRAKEEEEAAKERAKRQAENEANLKRAFAKLTSKYGAKAVKQVEECELKGLPIKLISEYIYYTNKYRNSYTVTLDEYEPSVADAIKYGAGIRVYLLRGNPLWGCKLYVRNGKVISQIDYLI